MPEIQRTPATAFSNLLIRSRWTAMTLFVGLALTACASGPERPIVGRISALPGVEQPTDNPSTPAKVALGAQLFVDKRLSGSGQTACQSCHYRHLGWADGLAFSRRDDGQMNTRHTPSLYNAGHQTAWYWDGRASSLEAQILAAWKSQNGADPAVVAARLNAIPGYRGQFQAVFGGPATAQNIPQALAAYLRGKRSENAPWDRYEQGDVKAVSEAAIEGYKLFAGKARCAVCHAAPYYGNGGFHNVGLEARKNPPDPGRFAVTGAESDRAAFKTPSLRSAALSAPYFHDGSARTLREAVKYMAAGGGRDRNKSPALKDVDLDDEEIDQIVAFINSLTSNEVWRAPALP
jgi:cytochrome c peroxidase